MYWNTHVWLMIIWIWVSKYLEAVHWKITAQTKNLIKETISKANKCYISTNYINRIFPYNISHCYADDKQLYLLLRPGKQRRLAGVVRERELLCSYKFCLLKHLEREIRI